MPGRTIPHPGFAGDDGRADPALTAALARDHDDPAFLPELLAALHGARVLAPVVALLGETEGTADGLVQDKTADIAVPVLLDDVGDRALPVFTDVAALAAWDPRARPVPVDGPR
ncbi:MAG: SseB family protein, partial [Sporichthyaceae bacterium]